MDNADEDVSSTHTINAPSSSPSSAPATGETTRLTPTEAAHEHELLWQHLADAGIRVRPDFRRPTHWVAAVLTHQTEAHATREDATLAAIRWLIDELHRERTARERAVRPDWWKDLFG